MEPSNFVLKPLVWSPEQQPNDSCHYNHVVADTPLGLASIEWKGWKDYDGRCVYIDGDYLSTSPTLDEAQRLVVNYLRNVVSALTDTSWVDVKDRLPVEGTEVLVYIPAWKQCVVAYVNHDHAPNDWQWDGEHLGTAYAPSHWQALPPLPIEPSNASA